MKVSIVIPVKYGIDTTQVCLDSIKLYTTDYELIIVNDGGDQEISVFLDSVDKDCLIKNDISLGFPGAVNLGIEKANGDYVIILNNDTVVMPHWTEKMIEHFENDSSLGELSCTTNQVEGFQHINHNKKGVDFQYADVVTGILMMFPKEILEKLKEQEGYYFDARFGKGGQEDSDISMRVHKLGYKVGIARNVFIYHYGSMSFREVFKNNAPLSIEYAKSRVKILRDKYKNQTMDKQNITSIKAQEENVGIVKGTSYTSKKKKLVMIAIPTLGTVRVELIPRLIHYSKNQNYDVVIPMETPVLQPLDNARNWWVKKFLEISNDSDDCIWFIDDDIIPPFDALDRLAGHDVDAVGATCFVMKNHDGEYFPHPVALRYNENKEFVVHYGQGLEEVDGTGGGCIMVKRKVYESMDRPYEYKYYPDGTLELVADFHFCQKLKEKNWKLYFDFDCVADHIKAVSIKGFNDLLLKVQRDAQQQNK